MKALLAGACPLALWPGGRSPWPPEEALNGPPPLEMNGPPPLEM